MAVNPESESSVTKLLAERAKLDEQISRDYTREVTIFFCDIKGYTSYTETHGDLSGRALAQQVTEVAFPALKEFDGNLVKTIGDAVMAFFDDPVKAVRFAMALQDRIKNANISRPGMRQVHLRIGLNLGKVIIDDGDLFGDAVNIAARIEPQAKPDGILISPSLYKAIQSADDIVCQYAKQVTMKGKSEPMDLYQVVWDNGRCDDYSDEAKITDKSAPKEKSKILEGKKGLALKLAIAAISVLSIIIVLKKYQPSEPLTQLPEKKPISLTTDTYSSGYLALRQGALDRANTLFGQLAEDDPRRYEVKTALSLARKDYKTAQVDMSQALEKAGDRVFVHVMNGDLQLHNAKKNLALNSYKKASLLDKGDDWQRAMAYNGLGRINAANGNNDKALASYQEAASLDPNNADILTNQGVMQERLGHKEDALKSYQKALKVNPEDALARRKLALAERREKASLDQEKQARINQLVDDLAAQFKSGTILPPVKGSKESTTMSAWLMEFDEKGDLPPREGEADVFMDLFGQELQAAGGIELVERTLLDSLLSELKLGTSALADRQTSLQLGRLLAAKFMIKGSVYRKSDIIMISVKVIETETSRIRAATTVEIKGGDELFTSAGQVAKAILTKLAKIYPEVISG